jgi:serine protease AprX
MAAPHVTGMVALLVQTNPKLTPDQVRVALQSTARPMADGSPLSRSGYGVIDAGAVDLVAKRGWATKLDALQRKADRRLGKAQTYRLRIADHWGFTAPALAVAGSDAREFTVEVARGTTAVKVAVAFPPVPPGVVPVSNRGGYEVTLLDAQGREVAAAAPGKQATTVSLVNLPPAAAFGTWTLVLRSVVVFGPDTLGPDLPGDPPAVDAVTVTMAQLVEKRPGG